MLIGVISDTHDRVPMIEKAVELFNASEVRAVLHCGDFVSPFSLRPFEKLQKPFYAVFGNNDGEKSGIQDMFDQSGWVLNDRPCAIDFEGASIAMLHEPDMLGEFVASDEYDLIVYGHTHEKYFDKIKNSMVINPGEGCGWVSGEATIAFADIEKGACKFEMLE